MMLKVVAFLQMLHKLGILERYPVKLHFDDSRITKNTLSVWLEWEE